MVVGDKANIQNLIILLYICNKVKIKDVIYNTILKKPMSMNKSKRFKQKMYNTVYRKL